MMSDYFAALMRASNLFASSAAPIPEAPLEFGVEVPAATLSATPAPRPVHSETRAAVVASEQSMPAAPVAQPAPPRQRDDNRPATRSLPDTAAQGPRAEPSTVPLAAAQSRPGIERPADGPPRHPQADERVQAAMRWVASDPQLESPVRQAPMHRAEMTDIPEIDPPAIAAVPPQAIAPLDPPRSPLAADVASIPLPAPVAMPVQSTESARRHAEPEAQVATAEELLEISIGAIHLRVEAPAPRTLARPATPAVPVQQPAAPASPTRSGLSRRALRRL